MISQVSARVEKQLYDSRQRFPAYLYFKSARGVKRKFTKVPVSLLQVLECTRMLLCSVYLKTEPRCSHFSFAGVYRTLYTGTTPTVFVLHVNPDRLPRKHPRCDRAPWVKYGKASTMAKLASCLRTLPLLLLYAISKLTHRAPAIAAPGDCFRSGTPCASAAPLGRWRCSRRLPSLPAARGSVPPISGRQACRHPRPSTVPARPEGRRQSTTTQGLKMSMRVFMDLGSSSIAAGPETRTLARKREAGCVER